MNKLIATLVVVALPAVTLAAGGTHHPEKADVIPTFQTGLMPAILTLVVFVGLVLILTKAAWGPIAKGLGDREAKIRRDIEEAEAARKAALAEQAKYQAEMAKAGEQVRSIIEKATADAQAAATRIKMQAQQEAEEAKERALKDIDASRRAAVAELHEQAATISTAIAEKILRRNLNVDDQRELVRSALEQLNAN